MLSIGIFYGSQTGNTETVADQIAAQLSDLSPDVHNIANADEAKMLSYDVILIGIPTWNIGELQSDWDSFFPKMSEMDWTNKIIAIFGLGDCAGYPDSYQDGMGILYEPIVKRGGTVIGFTSTDGYSFTTSRAVIDGNFCGLCIDQDQEYELTEGRLAAWCAQLRTECGWPQKA